jgi:hypothetical protein
VLPGTTVRLADGDTVRLGGDAVAEVLLPRQEFDPASLSRETEGSADPRGRRPVSDRP